MSPASFTKRYAEPERAAGAVRHYRWLTAHAKPLRQPALHTAGPQSLTFERIEGRPVRPENLPRVEELLGHAHGAAWASDLHSASLDTPHHFEDGTQFDDYLGPPEGRSAATPRAGLPAEQDGTARDACPAASDRRGALRLLQGQQPAELHHHQHAGRRRGRHRRPVGTAARVPGVRSVSRASSAARFDLSVSDGERGTILWEELSSA